MTWVQTNLTSETCPGPTILDGPAQSCEGVPIPCRDGRNGIAKLCEQAIDAMPGP